MSFFFVPNALARQNYNSCINTDYQKYLSNVQRVNSSYASKLAKTNTAPSVDNSADALKGYSTVSLTLGKNTYTLPQMITTLADIGMSDENIEKFLNNNGIR